MEARKFLEEKSELHHGTSVLNSVMLTHVCSSFSYVACGLCFFVNIFLRRKIVQMKSH